MDMLALTLLLVHLMRRLELLVWTMLCCIIMLLRIQRRLMFLGMLIECRLLIPAWNT
jgi:hypothetical protein